MSREVYEQVRQAYNDDELAQAVYEDLDGRGHADKVAAGELSIPSKVDARKWLDRKLGRDNETPSEREAHRKIKELETKLAEITGEERG